MKTFALKYRLFLIYSVVIALVVVLFSAVLFVGTIWMNRQTELYHQTELYKKNLGQVENILWQMDRLASQVSSNNEILAGFIPLALSENTSNHFTTHLMDSIRVSSLLSSINGTDRYASRISVFNRHGDHVSAGTLYETPEAVRDALTEERYDAIIDSIIRGGGGPLVVGFHTDTWSNNPGIRLLSLYRSLSSYTSTVYGLVEIQVSADTFTRTSLWQNEDSEYYLIDGEGGVVYPFVEVGNAGELFAGLSDALEVEEDNLALIERRIGRDDMILMCARVFPSDWFFVRALPARSLLAPYTRTILITLCACIALLCCLIVVMYYLANRIAKPVRQLSDRIAGVNLQNMQQSIQDNRAPYSIEELDTLNRAFLTTLSRLDQSISMEIQAHMRALQSQMNPHFLFNMLSVIIESSTENGDGRTVAMCLKLSAMLRYIADFNGDSASLAEEVQHARNYLDLMKDRYEDQFSYEVVTSGDIADVMVPKIILQPLAENCFSHGFIDVKPPWRIRVEIISEDSRWRLRVEDNGSGVTEETIRAIRQKVDMYRSDVATNYQNLRLGGMGLVNTLLRLSLSQRGRTDFVIANGKDRGTLVEIGGCTE
ncbi:MAG: histidine kinase [Clostridia bacterium]|nr:histidine kinase [Clostridia bacterium]